MCVEYTSIACNDRLHLRDIKPGTYDTILISRAIESQRTLRRVPDISEMHILVVRTSICASPLPRQLISSAIFVRAVRHVYQNGNDGKSVGCQDYAHTQSI